MSLTFHPLWPLLEPHLVIEEYDRDGGHENPRIRIELRDLPPDLAVAAADLIMGCVRARSGRRSTTRRRVRCSSTSPVRVATPLETSTS